MEKKDIIVIGAGIAGITASIYLSRLNADFVLLEGNEVAGKLNKIKEIENYPGFTKISGQELKENLIEQMENLNIKVRKENVQNVLMDKDGFRLVSDVSSYIAKSIIVASGVSENEQTLKGEKEYFGNGVSYCAICDGTFYKNTSVAVIGNNEIAIEEALYLSSLVKKLYLISESSLLNGNQNLINSIKNKNNVEILLNEKALEIKGDNLGVTKLITNKRELLVSGVFPYFGHKNTTMFLSNLRPNFNGNFLLVNDSMETTVPGLFASGDIVDKQLRQLLTAANDGAIAATNAFKFVKARK